MQIKIFDQYITFFNPGKLYGDLTVDDLKTDNYQANTRNKLIAEAFYLTGDIEKYGSGFRRIRREIEQYPTMKFDYQEIANGFLATVSYSKQKTTTIEQKGSEKTVGKTVEKTVEKIKNIIADNPYITQEEIVKITGLSRRGVEWNIAKLKTQGLIERIGPDNGGYWEIVK